MEYSTKPQSKTIQKVHVGKTVSKADSSCIESEQFSVGDIFKTLITSFLVYGTALNGL